MTSIKDINKVADSIKGIVIATIIISIIGYADYITGEISLDVLYILCLCLVAWYTNTFIGLLCVGEIITAKTTADYFANIKVGSHINEWNAINYLVMYLIVCILVVILKKTLSK
jgi:hypothetical protein